MEIIVPQIYATFKYQNIQKNLPKEPPRNTEAIVHPRLNPFSAVRPKCPLRDDATIEEIDGFGTLEETLNRRLDRAVAVMMNFEAVMIQVQVL